MWLLAFLTLIVRDWIEVVFRVDPDTQSGTAEWLIVLLLGAGVVVSTGLAGYERRRTSTLGRRGVMLPRQSIGRPQLRSFRHAR